MKPTFPALLMMAIGAFLIYAGIRGWSGTPELEFPTLETPEQGDVYR